MSSDARLGVVLCWHMHQPQYQDATDGHFTQPWVYLHGIKDYVDMAAHLELEPGARAVVNFAPILIEQIERYAQAITDHREGGAPLPDPLLAALAGAPLPAEEEPRLALALSCLRSNEKRLIDRFPAYHRLAALVRLVADHPGQARYLSDELIADLLVWYHLAWMGETVRRSDPRVRAWMDKEIGFTLEDRRALVLLVGDLLQGILPRYRALAESGRVELSFTPYAHPISPLLLDFASAREALPDVPLPEHATYPGGAARAHWHIEEGMRVFERAFGFRPRGCWPSEGGVSTDALRLLGTHGVRWAASGENVLRNSLRAHRIADDDPHKGWLHHPWTVADSAVRLFCRDDGLSDLIGFSYSSWHADDAVANLMGQLEIIAGACANRPGSTVSIILDGENAWEYYPENGIYFLSALYRKLANHPRLRLTTFSEALETDVRPAALPGVVAGSWVYGTFSTWIGDREKNRGWDLLCEAKRAFDAAVAGGLKGERLRAAELQLALCEGSDWFWWFGDYNPAAAVSDFERLYRTHLRNLYRAIGVTPPAVLDVTFTRGSGAPASGGVMRPGQTS